MSATYTKLKDGSWGVRVAGKAVAGAALDVTKKDGSRKNETVKSVLWTGADSKTGATISLCSIAQTGSSNGHSSHRPGTCMHCGDVCNPKYRTCLECAHGGMSYYDRNGNFVLGSDD